MGGASNTGRLRSIYRRTSARVESGIELAERRYTPLGRFRPGPFSDWRFLWQPALLGFLALTAILVGASFSDSPFKLNQAHTWFFGVPTVAGTAPPPTNETTLMFSIVLVFGGLVLLMRVWLRLAEVVKLHAGSPIRNLYWMLALWSVPMIAAPPLFSRDVFSYAAQGQMTSFHYSPYIYGPWTLGSGPWVSPVDILWTNTPAPYGPLFLFLDGSVVKATGHDWIASVVGLRLLEVAAVALLAAALPMLASAIHRDPGEALVLGALNPIVLLTLIGGAHNDALMTALLVMGIACAAKKHPIIGVVLVTCAAAIKAPAALGLVYIAWTWLGSDVNWRHKFKPFATTAAIAIALLSVFTLMAGFGFGWVRNLLTPGTVRSWAAPATASGLAITDIIHVFGGHLANGAVIKVTRIIGLVGAVSLSLWLLATSDRRGWVRSLGLSLLLFVILGPVVQPWYLVWGIALLAVSYRGRDHFWLLLLTIVGPFLGLPGGKQLLSGLVHANPFAMIAALAILAGMLLLPLGSWTQWSWPAEAPDEVNSPV